jgi:ElaA protein
LIGRWNGAGQVGREHGGELFGLRAAEYPACDRPGRNLESGSKPDIMNGIGQEELTTVVKKQDQDNPQDIRWHESDFAGLSSNQLYAILAARVAVFVVEQDCPYPELDGLDQSAHHIWAEDSSGRIAAYARITAPGTRFEEPSIGRVITSLSCRGTGLGRKLMVRAVAYAERLYPGASLRISAQQHLEAFYQELSFQFVRGPYDEDGIAHIEMLRSKQ